MTERPILFSAPMVRALLAGTKTQTRRVAKLTANGHVKEPGGHRRWHPADPNASQACPYGQPGDRLWVREAWRVAKKWDTTPPRDLPPRSMTVEYEAGGYACNSIVPGEGWIAREALVRQHPEWVGKYRPGMFMPRWASRITLEVTGVRVERLQDISEADAIAEGIEKTKHGFWSTYGQSDVDGTYSPQASYRALWESINGPESWTANPWVWAISFKHLESV